MPILPKLSINQRQFKLLIFTTTNGKTALVYMPSSLASTYSTILSKLLHIAELPIDMSELSIELTEELKQKALKCESESWQFAGVYIPDMSVLPKVFGGNVIFPFIGAPAVFKKTNFTQYSTADLMLLATDIMTGISSDLVTLEEYDDHQLRFPWEKYVNNKNAYDFAMYWYTRLRIDCNEEDEIKHTQNKTTEILEFFYNNAYEFYAEIIRKLRNFDYTLTTTEYYHISNRLIYPHVNITLFRNIQAEADITAIKLNTNKPVSDKVKAGEYFLCAHYCDKPIRSAEITVPFYILLAIATMTLAEYTKEQKKEEV